MSSGAHPLDASHIGEAIFWATLKEMVRSAFCLSLLTMTVGCAAARSPKVGHAGMAMAITGVGGIIASALASSYTSQADEMMLGSEVISAAGILLYAAHELSGPEVVYKQETTAQRHTRWARVLTEHAGAAAREGNCARVRKWEPRVQFYDPNIHDFVFMRDPEIVRCLASDADLPPEPSSSDAAEPGEAPPDRAMP